MTIKEVDGRLELWIEVGDKVFVVVSNPPNFAIDAVLRHVSDNTFEISSFDLLEPLNQLRIVRTLKEIKNKCQDQF